MQDEDGVQELLDYGLTPEERIRLNGWEDGFGTEFWALVEKNLQHERANHAAFCTNAANETEWRVVQGRIMEIDRLLNLRNQIRLTYAQVAQERKNELEQTLSHEEMPEDRDFV